MYLFSNMCIIASRSDEPTDRRAKMSTRAMYTFIEPEHTDSKRGYHVYKHHDGYPSGAAQWIENALPHAWKGGRFEADEFAAAFVAGNKSPYIRDELELLRQIVDGPVVGD